MNTRIKQQIRALEKLRTVEPIMAILEDEQDRHFHRIVFIHPDDWEDAKQVYGERLREFL